MYRAVQPDPRQAIAISPPAGHRSRDTVGPDSDLAEWRQVASPRLGWRCRRVPRPACIRVMTRSRGPRGRVARPGRPDGQRQECAGRPRPQIDHHSVLIHQHCQLLRHARNSLPAQSQSSARAATEQGASQLASSATSLAICPRLAHTQCHTHGDSHSASQPAESHRGVTHSVSELVLPGALPAGDDISSISIVVIIGNSV